MNSCDWTAALDIYIYIYLHDPRERTSTVELNTFLMLSIFNKNLPSRKKVFSWSLFPSFGFSDGHVWIEQQKITFA